MTDERRETGLMILMAVLLFIALEVCRALFGPGVMMWLTGTVMMGDFPSPMGLFGGAFGALATAFVVWRAGRPA